MPRSPPGRGRPRAKAKAAQNAVQHGLLARQAVVVGEEPDEFGLFRDQLRAELAPVGLAESLLVERIVGLSWRLQRAERLHTEAFDVLYAQCAADPQIKRRWPAQGPEAADPIIGVTVVKDFSETKVLERLLMYERRIENSLYRTMAELRKVQGLRGQETAEAVGSVPVRAYCGTGIPSAALSGQALTVVQNHGQDAHATIPPDGVTTNLAEAEGQSCETNPICAGPRSTGILPGNLSHGRDAHATVPEAQSESCETNPICAGANKSQAGYRPVFRRRR